MKEEERINVQVIRRRERHALVVAGFCASGKRQRSAERCRICLPF